MTPPKVDLNNRISDFNLVTVSWTKDWKSLCESVAFLMYASVDGTFEFVI